LAPKGTIEIVIQYVNERVSQNPKLKSQNSISDYLLNPRYPLAINQGSYKAISHILIRNYLLNPRYPRAIIQGSYKSTSHKTKLNQRLSAQSASSACDLSNLSQ